MTKSISQILDDLRGKRGAAEQRQMELDSEIEEISFAAHTGDAKAKKRLDEITNELSHLATEIKSTTAALAEGARRQLQEREEEMSAQRRADAEKAETVMAEVEKLAAAIDAAMASLKAAAVDFQNKMEMARRLSGAGPQHQAIKVLLARAISAGLMGLPQHPDLLAPNERRSVTELTTAWAQQVRNRIATINEPAKAG
jgi:chromosome segregation ATPase